MKPEEQARQKTDAIPEAAGSGSRVVEYLTDLPPRDVLEKKLHHAVLAAQERLALPRFKERRK
jgi:hypothetical protein